MENASKALLIGAGVLIGVIILSMAVYLFGFFGRYAENTQNRITENQLAQFNDKFLKYSGLTDLTIQDLITVKNYALESNNKYGNYNLFLNEFRAADNNEYIDVFYKNISTTQILIFYKSDEELLKESLNKKYTCKEVVVNRNTGRVNKIYFEEQVTD